MPRPENPIFRHFEEVSGDASRQEGFRYRRVRCSFCGSSFAKNATQLRGHLTTCPAAPEDVRREMYIRSEEPTQASQSSAGGGFRYSGFRNQTVLPYASMSESAQKAVNMEWVKWMIARNLPFTIFGEGGHPSPGSWAKAMEVTCPEYLARAANPGPLTRKKAVRIVSEIQSSVGKSVDELLAKEKGLAIIIDGWTTRKGQGVKVICLRTLNGAIFFPPNNFLSGGDDSISYTEAVEATLASPWGHNVSALVSDNAAVMSKMRSEIERKTGILTSPCCYHILDSIGGAILELPRFQKTLHDASVIVKFMKLHHRPARLWRDFQATTSFRAVSFKLPGATRRLSACRMLESLARNGDALRQFVNSREYQEMLSDLRKEKRMDMERSQKLKAVETRDIVNDLSRWDDIQAMEEFLRMFSVMQRFTEKAVSNLSDGYWIFLCLKEHIKKHEKYLEKDVSAVSTVVDKYLAKANPRHLYELASKLDPRTNFKVKGGDEGKAVVCLQNLSKSAPNSGQIMTEFIALTSGRALHPQAIKLGKDGRLEGPMTVTDWWQLWGSAFPNLYKHVVQPVFSIPLSAAAVERVNSMAGRTQSEVRVRMSNTTAADLVSLRINVATLESMKMGTCITDHPLPHLRSGHEDEERVEEAGDEAKGEDDEDCSDGIDAFLETARSFDANVLRELGSQLIEVAEDMEMRETEKLHEI